MGLRWTEANHLLATSLVQAAAEIRTHEIFCFTGGLAAHFEQPPALDKLSAEISLQIQLSMNGVQRRRMILPQFELGGGSISRSGATDQDSCGGAGADSLNELRQIRR